eukprot:CAMPEP_0194090780 /NCGR_PEP_ID=MMETSP0149-20130528/40559_1 /TAXON_ID=122233 /ORGANISM="Chaetoceros debilis, Strain MM31A-1" /LENGTH=497 /DNA_ID=CAMNT_0038775161 /DNA_START=90 /DNA_END=1580 /DNA_ORIENTATION=+
MSPQENGSKKVSHGTLHEVRLNKEAKVLSASFGSTDSETCSSSSGNADSMTDKESSARHGAPICPTTSLLLLNLVDMFSVALVVPLLNQYYQDAGVSNASTRELLSSLFSTSQIIGALVMGALADSGILSRKRILYVSFLGSALSYSLIVYGGIRGLIMSRVIVGTVKQTSTISTSMLASYTTLEERAAYMGRLSASVTLAFILGPTVGAYLHKNVDKRAPAILASCLFVFNFFLASILLPDEQPRKDVVKTEEKVKKGNKFSSFADNLKACFTSKNLSAVVLSSLMYHFIYRATSYATMPSYYEQMFNIETHQRGYLRSYQSTISFLFQTFGVRYTLQRLGGEYKAVCFAAGAIAVATTLELNSNFTFFLCIVSPMLGAANSLLRLSLRSLVTQVAPKESLGSVLAALDVLQNVCSVSVPFYRTLLFHFLTGYEQEGDGFDSSQDGSMRGDPCPRMWLKSSLIHWTITALLMSHFLLRSTKRQMATPTGSTPTIEK